ncbi:outer envelope pore protein 16-2, chloroplastic [Phalaenopsis equestris]|uniref:outer envelope pore protein 16-2, chloroplastic n=1 Tax=Phalaenopsis equestris TaxID=78828 RepID=UPI0009E21470|nr:outer envelope pore protein 16-2, chloroplastic [Phalaenopsis equestris]
MSELKSETRNLIDDLRNFDKGSLFDLGHPLLNRIADSFVKAAGIGAIHAVSRDVYFSAVDGSGIDSSTVPDLSGAKKRRFPDLRGDHSNNSLEALLKNTGRESFQWGLTAGIYSGLTYSLREARGTHDWKNSAVAGAVTGAALALTSQGATQEQLVHYAITGAAISAAASLLRGIF